MSTNIYESIELNILLSCIWHHEDNAAFAVRAVNSHRALVASLEEMLSVYWGAGDGELPEPACIIRARAALAKARGEA